MYQRWKFSDSDSDYFLDELKEFLISGKEEIDDEQKYSVDISCYGCGLYSEAADFSKEIFLIFEEISAPIDDVQITAFQSNKEYFFVSVEV